MIFWIELSEEGGTAACTHSGGADGVTDRSSVQFDLSCKDANNLSENTYNLQE